MMYLVPSSFFLIVIRYFGRIMTHILSVLSIYSALCRCGLLVGGFTNCSFIVESVHLRHFSVSISCVKLGFLFFSFFLSLLFLLQSSYASFTLLSLFLFAFFLCMDSHRFTNTEEEVSGGGSSGDHPCHLPDPSHSPFV